MLSCIFVSPHPNPTLFLVMTVVEYAESARKKAATQSDHNTRDRPLRSSTIVQKVRASPSGRPIRSTQTARSCPFGSDRGRYRQGVWPVRPVRPAAPSGATHLSVLGQPWPEIPYVCKYCHIINFQDENKLDQVTKLKQFLHIDSSVSHGSMKNN